MSKKNNKKAQQHQKTTNILLPAVTVCFILSGFAALLYQTAWMRQFSFVFGTSELAVAAVLSAYMGGLALGSAIAARYVDRITRPVLFYGVLEAGIALSALAVPLLLKLANLAYIGVFGGQPEPVDASGLGQSFFYLIIAFIVLAIPTTFMGATLPLLTKYVVQSDKQVGPRVGFLYAMNTIGAVAGTIVAGFILLPKLGLNGTVWVGIAINLLVFILAALVAKSIGDHSKLKNLINTAETASDSSTSSKSIQWILPIMLVSGANSFVYEVLWTRLLGHILGGSIAAFATMLAGFLSGIAIGSAVASRFATDRVQAIKVFIGVQFGIALASMLIYQLLPLAIPEVPGLKGNVPLVILFLLPATIFIGATFPLAVRILADNAAAAAASSARVYTWNTVGAIVGATAAAFFLIPALKYEGAIKFAVVVNLLLAVAAATVIGKQHKRTAIGAVVCALAMIVIYRPAIPEQMLRTSPVFIQDGGELRHYEVGRSATVLVIEENGYLNLRTNGLPEASTNLVGAPPDKHTQRLLSTMPVLARPDIKSMLVVGFGAGVTLENIPPSVEEIDVIELEPEVIVANRTFSAERETNPLDDPRINITINDARSALMLTDKKYDSIVSQPSHPWTAGASHLYTREFMQLAADHLSSDGVYLQWMNTQFVDQHLLKSLCKTMLDVFPNVRIYQWDPEVLFFLGSENPLDVELDIARTGRPLNEAVEHYREKGIGSLEDILAALTLDQENLEAYAETGDIITDDFNIMATRSALAMENDTTLTMHKLFKEMQPYDPLLQSNNWLHTKLSSEINFSYLSKRIESGGDKQRAIDLANLLFKKDDPQALIMIGIGQQAQGEHKESQENILKALEKAPDNQQARYTLLRPWFSSFSNGAEVPDYVTDELANMNGTAAATLRAWLAASKMNFNELAQLDEELAKTLPTDAWYLDSLKLRADWRIKVTSPGFQPRMAREATQLIDNAIAIFNDPEFYNMRLASSYVANDALETIETARRLIYIFESEINRAEKADTSPDSNSIAIKLRQVEAASNVLRNIANDERVPTYKVRLLEDSITTISERLKAMPNYKPG